MNEEYKKIFRAVKGFLQEHEAEYLYNTPERVGEGNYADLGTLQGLSSSLLAAGLRDRKLTGKIVTVDTFQGESLLEKWNQQHPKDEVERRAQEYIAPLSKAEHHWNLMGVTDYVLPYVGLTSGAAEEYANWTFNFVFVDADHSYEGAKRDFEDWSKLLSPSGEIAFHDSFSRNHGVRILMAEMPNRGWKLANQVGAIRSWVRE